MDKPFWLCQCFQNPSISAAEPISSSNSNRSIGRRSFRNPVSSNGVTHAKTARAYSPAVTSGEWGPEPATRYGPLLHPSRTTRIAFRAKVAVKTAGMAALIGTSQRVRRSATSRSKDTARNRLKRDDGRGDLACSARERTQDIKLEAKDTHAAATETRSRRELEGRVAQSTTSTR